MIPIKHKKVESIISGIINSNIEISSGNFIEFTINSIIYIAYSRSNEIPTHPFGLIILENVNNTWRLYPSILSLLKINNKIIITTKELIDKVTKGQSIDVDSQDGVVLLYDKHDRILSLGKISQQVFYPVVDLGFYLRSETPQ